MKKKYIKLPPEMVDGDHWSIAEIDGHPLAGQAIRAWAEDAEVGESVTLEIIEMTDEEVEALPEI